MYCDADSDFDFYFLCTVDSGSGPTRLMATFRLMARSVQERLIDWLIDCFKSS